jgi:hypothetical protein
MKEVMGTCPVLELPDFTLPFVLECDASGEGIGVVLMQGGHPIVFESQNLNQLESLYSIYDKEMLAIMHALTKFKQYLVGNKFVVKTDHNSLKYLLEQKDLSERCYPMAYLYQSLSLNCHLYLYYSFSILVIYLQVMTSELVKIA